MQYTIYSKLYKCIYAQYTIYSILNSNTIYWHCILIQLQCIIQIQWVNFLSQHSTCIFSIRFFLDNAYGTIILQASSSKYLIEHEHVQNYISLNMNVLKITNNVLCLQASFKLVLPNISFNMNVLKIISQ
jgi:hypothetical protein